MKVLIPECGGPAGIGAIKSLKQNDTKNNEKNVILGYDIDKFCAATVLVDHFFQSPKATNLDFIPFFEKLLSNVDIVIPTSENDLTILAKNKNSFPKELKFVCNSSTVNVCRDKMETYYALADFNFVPKSSLTRFSNIIFYKPRFGKGSRDCRLISDPKEKISEFDTGNFIFQEYLPGEEITVDALFDAESKLRFCISRERIKTRGGISTCARFISSLPYKKIILEISKILTFNGPICFQFKKDQFDQIKLIEINTRLSGGYALSLPLTANNFLSMMLTEKYPQEDSSELYNETIISRIFEEVVVVR